LQEGIRSPLRGHPATFRRRNGVPQAHPPPGRLASRYRDAPSRREATMLPLACFAALAVVGQTLNVLFGLAIEKYLTNATSILVFFLLFLGVFYGSWRLTQWIVDR